MPPQQEHKKENPFAVDPTAEVSVGVQLSWRLRTLILSGRLRAGDALPSVRRLADWAGVNANTARASYESLQAEGLIKSRQGKGTYVSEDAAPTPGLEQILLDTVRRGRESGMGPRDLAIAFMACADLLDGEETSAVTSTPPDIDAVEGETIGIRNELRRQISQLEFELGPYVPDLAPGELPTAPRWAQGHIADVGELEEIRDILFAKLFKARQAAETRARQEAEARAVEAGGTGGGPLAAAMSWWQRAMRQPAR